MKQKVLSILALLLVAATGAVAQTYSVTLPEGTEDAENWTISDGTNSAKGNVGLSGLSADANITIEYTGTKRVASVTAVKEASALRLDLTSPAVGQVIGSDGKNYAADATLPTGVTKVAMITYLNGSNGLAIALADESPTGISLTDGETAAAAHTPVFTNGTWRVPSKDEWNQMFTANGDNISSYTGLNTKLATAGGDDSKLQTFTYWSSTCDENEGEDFYWTVELLFDGSVNYKDYSEPKTSEYLIRAILAFTVEQGSAVEGHALSASAVGEIVGTDGKAYAVADKDNLPTGVTAVAMVAYKSATAGSSLAIALADEGEMGWATAKSTCEGKTAIGDYSWKLSSQDEWKNMFKANGDDEESYSGLNTALAAAGGDSSKLQEGGDYWSSTEDGYINAWNVILLPGAGSTMWNSDYKDQGLTYWVRARLAF